MRKVVLFLLIISLVACVFLPTLSGCEVSDDGRLSVVVTLFSEYDWVMNVLGERAKDVNVKILLDSNIDMHSYNMTVDDKIRILESDVFIYVGGESDERWVPGVLREVKNDSMKTLCLLDILGDAAKEEEVVDGMQTDEEEEDEASYDEHVWLSLRNAVLFVNKIAEALSEADPEYAEVYTANAAAYASSLEALDGRYLEMRAAAERDFILVADRFPFRYLVDDYDIGYAAAFLGCAADSEVTPETRKNLIDVVNAREIEVLLILESSDGKDARAIRDGSARKDQEILVLDSLQSAGEKEYKEGRTYLSVMEENLEVLRKALS